MENVFCSFCFYDPGLSKGDGGWGGGGGGSLVGVVIRSGSRIPCRRGRRPSGGGAASI